jgi:hypothetical protein
MCLAYSFLNILEDLCVDVVLGKNAWEVDLVRGAYGGVSASFTNLHLDATSERPESR